MYSLFYNTIPVFMFIFLQVFEASNMLNSRDVQFSLIEDAKMEKFEKKIGYFFNAKNPTPIIEAYVKALKKLEEIGSHCSMDLLEKELIPYLEEAYKEVSEQQGLHFNAHKAAKLELQIILGNANGASFESVQNNMSRLYTLIFKSTSPNIRKAAMLRTFLYQYKVAALKRDKALTDAEMKMMISLSETSKELLNSIQ